MRAPEADGRAVERGFLLNVAFFGAAFVAALVFLFAGAAFAGDLAGAALAAVLAEAALAGTVAADPAVARVVGRDAGRRIGPVFLVAVGFAAAAACGAEAALEPAVFVGVAFA